MKYLMSVVAVLAIVGCGNDHNNVVVVPEEPLVMSEQVHMKCGEPFSFKVEGKNISTNVSIEYNETEEAYNEEWGLEVAFTVVTPCEDIVPPTDGNGTFPITDPTNPIPVDG